MGIDQVIDFLNDQQQEQQEQEHGWSTVKIYVAAFRWFYSHVLQAKEFARLIPYPKDKPLKPSRTSGNSEPSVLCSFKTLISCFQTDRKTTKICDDLSSFDFRIYNQAR